MTDINSTRDAEDSSIRDNINIGNQIAQALPLPTPIATKQPRHNHGRKLPVTNKPSTKKGKSLINGFPGAYRLPQKTNASAMLLAEYSAEQKKERQTRKKALLTRRRRNAQGAPVRTDRSLPLRQIRHYQTSVALILPRASFGRLVREIATTQLHGVRFQAGALLALQEAAEALLVRIFEDCNLLAVHGRRVTIMQKDIKTLGRILRNWGVQEGNTIAA